MFFQRIAELPTPDKAGFSSETLEYLPALAGFMEHSGTMYQLNFEGKERYSKSHADRNYLISQPLIHQSRIQPEVFKELLGAGYVSIPENDEDATAGFLVNQYHYVHPYAVVAGSHGATHEVFIYEERTNVILGYIRCTDVRVFNEMENGIPVTRLRLNADGVSENHQTAYLSEVKIIGNLSNVDTSTGSFRIDGLLSHISGYRLGRVPERITHHHDHPYVGYDDDVEKCDVKYSMPYMPPEESHQSYLYGAPTNKSDLSELDVFRGASAFIIVTPISRAV